MNADDLVLVFAITAAFDVFINLAPPPFGKRLLKGYFRKHTVLAAALIAGFVGAVTFALIASLIDVRDASPRNLLAVFVVSALVGFPMQASGMFPFLNQHYYEKMPRFQSFLADGLSGAMVAAVFWLARGVDTSRTTGLWLAAAATYALLSARGALV